ncbi:MAG: hypothetical protein IPP37_01185 [Saprospiraceae bacterium]|nr:hypothetical protein [Saprospiraceae bacterium]
MIMSTLNMSKRTSKRYWKTL